MIEEQGVGCLFLIYVISSKLQGLWAREREILCMRNPRKHFGSSTIWTHIQFVASHYKCGYCFKVWQQVMPVNYTCSSFIDLTYGHFSKKTCSTYLDASIIAHLWSICSNFCCLCILHIVEQSVELSNKQLLSSSQVVSHSQVKG